MPPSLLRRIPHLPVSAPFQLGTWRHHDTPPASPGWYLAAVSGATDRRYVLGVEEAGCIVLASTAHLADALRLGPTQRPVVWRYWNGQHWQWSYPAGGPDTPLVRAHLEGSDFWAGAGEEMTPIPVRPVTRTRSWQQHPACQKIVMGLRSLRDAWRGPDGPPIRALTRALYVLTGLPFVADGLLNPLSARTWLKTGVLVAALTASWPVATQFDQAREAAVTLTDEARKLAAWAQRPRAPCPEPLTRHCVLERLQQPEGYLFGSLEALYAAQTWLETHPEDAAVRQVTLQRVIDTLQQADSLTRMEDAQTTLARILNASWLVRAFATDQLEALTRPSQLREQFAHALPALLMSLERDLPRATGKTAFSIPEPAQP